MRLALIGMHNTSKKMEDNKFRELAARAGFVGSNLSNTVIGTDQETALKNFHNLVVEECAYIARQCYTVRAIDAEEVAQHIEQNASILS